MGYGLAVIGFVFYGVVTVNEILTLNQVNVVYLSRHLDQTMAMAIAFLFISTTKII